MCFRLVNFPCLRWKREGGCWGLFAPKPRTRAHRALDPFLGDAGGAAGYNELRRRTLGALRPQASNQGPSGPGPIFGMSAGDAPGRPAKPARGAQSAPGKCGNGQGENEFSSWPLPHFPLPRSLQTFLMLLAETACFPSVARRRVGCKGLAPCRGVQGPRRPLLRRATGGGRLFFATSCYHFSLTDR